jgi:hypothetical protein
MRELTDLDIERFNKRLEKSNLLFHLDGDSFTKYLNLSSVYRDINGTIIAGTNRPVPLDQKIKFEFSYAVSKNCLNRFDLLLNDLLQSGLEIRSLVNAVELKSSVNECNSKFIQTKIRILNTDYIQRKASFTEKIIDIFFYITCIEDAVNIISEYFEYTEDGEEIVKTKFKENEIVSLKSDKSGDYFVLSSKFKKVSDELETFYDLCKIETNTPSEVLIFGTTLTINESEIIPNRDFRIDSLLN